MVSVKRSFAVSKPLSEAGLKGHEFLTVGGPET